MREFPDEICGFPDVVVVVVQSSSSSDATSVISDIPIFVELSSEQTPGKLPPVNGRCGVVKQQTNVTHKKLNNNSNNFANSFFKVFC